MYTVYQLWSPSMSAASIGGSVAEHVQAEVPVEHVLAAEALLVLVRIEVRDRVDHVQLDVGPEAIEHQLRVLAPQRADLDDAPGAGRLEDGCDRNLPERKHLACAPP